MDGDEKIKILVVDDCPENVTALSETLNDPNYEIITALSGEQALKEVLCAEFAVILLDIQMPGLDGFETASLIRKRRKSRSIPIIFVTAINKEDRYVYKGYALGAVDYLFKPFDIDILRSKVAVFADLFRKNRQIKAQARLIQESERRERARQVAEVQRRGERRYQNLADLVPQLVWIITRDLRFEYVNQRALTYFHLDGESMAGLILEEVVHRDDLDSRKNVWREALLAGAELSMELRLRRGRDKAFRWHLVHIQPEHDARGRVRAWLGVATDIDDQRRVAEALAAEKERLSVTLRSIGDGVITTDTGGHVVLLNRAAEQLTGWTQEEAVGRPLAEVFVVREAPFFREAVNLGSTVAAGGGPDRQAVLIGRDAREWAVATGITPIRDAKGQVQGTAVVFRDVTDAQRLEEERQKASKLESVGLLAGAIAHDFNNILTAIMGNISLAKLYTSAGEQVFDRLEEAERAALWAKDLTQQLLTFSKGGAPVKRPIEIGSVVRDSAEFASRGSNILCDVSVNAQVVVEADEGQIRQVVHNLVLNAQQAMPEGGRVWVSIDEVRCTDGHGLMPGRYAEVVCRDEGMGISKENLARIFDPYFTTKLKGSGLGLATSYSIVRKHNGVITVESEPGQGAVFRILLPASDMGLPSSVNMVGRVRHGHGRILIMDDESFIRDILGRLFTHFGYEVGYAKDGAEALAAYKGAVQEHRPYHVVIMDLVIPGGMGGREAVRKLLEFDPKAKVIVSSGYSNDPIMANYRHYGFCEAVSKPYRNEELRTVVQKVLVP